MASSHSCRILADNWQVSVPCVGCLSVLMKRLLKWVTRESKEEAFYKLMLDIVYHHFHVLLFTRNKSQSPVHTLGRGNSASPLEVRGSN
jgi:hypothetical protein